jgi:hypothetical protein
MHLLEDMSESRRAARRGVEVACELITPRWNQPLATRGMDLSPYGMWIETRAPAAIGDEVVVCFTPPRRERELTLFARVCRIGEHDDGERGVGVEFEALDWFEQKTLADGLRGIPPRFPGRSRESDRHSVA